MCVGRCLTRDGTRTELVERGSARMAERKCTRGAHAWRFVDALTRAPLPPASALVTTCTAEQRGLCGTPFAMFEKNIKVFMGEAMASHKKTLMLFRTPVLDFEWT